MVELKCLIEMLKLQRLEKDKEKEDLIAAVTDAVEKHAIQNGHLTHSYLTEIIAQQNIEQQTRIDYFLSEREQMIETNLNNILNALWSPNLPPIRYHHEPPDCAFNVHNGTATQTFVHTWGGKFCHVLESFMYPLKCNRKRAW